MKTRLIPLSVIVVLAVASSAMAGSKLGDLTSFEVIASDTKTLIEKGDLKAAARRITDFETAWDKAQATLYPKDKTAWSRIDDAADAAIASLRAKRPTLPRLSKRCRLLIDTLKDTAAQ